MGTSVSPWLQEVAKKQMEEETGMEDSVKEALCAVFATCHRSTSDKSVEMLNKVGWCRSTVSKPLFKAPMLAALDTRIS